MITYIDLFSGPGGLCTGFKSEGLVPRIAVDFSEFTVQTYSKSHNAEIYELEILLSNLGHLENILNKNEKTCVIHGDINNVSNELILEILNKKFNEVTVDIVTGGAPCESFSMAGKRLEDDKRNDLFSNILRIAHCVDSKFVLFENVPGLLTKKRNGKVGGQIEYVFNEFEREDPITHHHYILASKNKEVYKCVASDYGTPQKRERLFIVGCNSKFGKNPFIYPEKTHGKGRKFNYITVEDALRYLPLIESNSGDEIMEYNPAYEQDYKEGKISEGAYLYYKFIFGDEYCENANFDKKHITYQKSLNHSKKMIQRFENIRQGEGMQSAANRLLAEGKENVVKACFPNKIYSSRNRRLILNEPSYTVTSHCLDEMVHPIANRQLTPREVARLQGFPDWYTFEGPYVKFHSDPQQDKYEQIGDAIPVIMAKALAKSFIEAINKLKK